jgi:hypothetical protein
MVLLSALLASCSGTTGSSGPAGATGATGAQGSTTTGSALNVSTATGITGKILSVAISGPPVVKFQLTDENGALLQGLPAADLSFTIAQLVPGQNSGRRLQGGSNGRGLRRLPRQCELCDRCGHGWHRRQ